MLAVRGVCSPSTPNINAKQYEMLCTQLKGSAHCTPVLVVRWLIVDFC
jgi:hypothetical protein